MQIENVLWRERRCWIFSNHEIRVVVTQWGAQFAEICFVHPPSINPLWVPPWPTMDNDSYQPELHQAMYGGNSESRLLSGIAGHTLCFPFWGDPTETEFRAGMTLHGEANLNLWELQRLDGDRVSLSAHFKESELVMSREITIMGARIECRSRAQNLSAWDRPVAWCEHVTFGPPFLHPGATEFEASAGEGFQTGCEDGSHFLWPEGRGAICCDLSTFSREQHRDLVNSFVVTGDRNRGRFLARNNESRLEIEYSFFLSDFPWLNVWENHDERMQTRGMEFSNTPRHGTMKALIKSSEVLGIPAYDWIGGRSELTKAFEIELRRR